MPWKGEKDPYKIWLSEIILQQTRVEQGLGYYKRFIRSFPNIQRLANSSDETVFKHWEGLGYYSRCRNLLITARFIASERKGKFPESYEEIRALKGVGPYTAAAISSFAYNLPHAVVDGNVFRVMARVFGESIPTDTTMGKKIFTALAEELLDKKQPGIYNQAIMDFGATICKPVSPLCAQCPFQQICFAYRYKIIAELPVKEKRIRMRDRWFYYFILEYRDQYVIRQRTSRDIWQQLYEFPLIESDSELSTADIMKKGSAKKIFTRIDKEKTEVSDVLRQQLSHQLIRGRFITLRLKTKPTLKDGNILVSKKKLNAFAFPKFITSFLAYGN